VSDVSQLYQAVIVDHDHAPRHHGRLASASHQASADNPLCGDECTLYLRLQGDRIEEASFEGRGCALSRAAASIMTEQLAGRDLAAARALAATFEAFVRAAPDAPAGQGDLGDLAAFLGVRRFRSRQACALLPFRALLAAVGRSS
jgi:nitrogen fixation protein NifU and related proteins